MPSWVLPALLQAVLPSLDTTTSPAMLLGVMRAGPQHLQGQDSGAARKGATSPPSLYHGMEPTSTISSEAVVGLQA